jgi:predicted nucleic acid-binding protein
LNLVDSSGWLEFFADGDNAEFFAVPILNLAELIVPTVCIYEVFKVTARQRGEQIATNVVSIMEKGVVVPLDAALAIEAARISRKHRIAMADSIIYATAQSARAFLWTQDADFDGLEGIRYISTG